MPYGSANQCWSFLCFADGSFPWKNVSKVWKQNIWIRIKHSYSLTGGITWYCTDIPMHPHVEIPKFLSSVIKITNKKAQVQSREVALYLAFVKTSLISCVSIANVSFPLFHWTVSLNCSWHPVFFSRVASQQLLSDVGRRVTMCKLIWSRKEQGIAMEANIY